MPVADYMIIRERPVRFTHPTPELVDGFQCNWPNGDPAPGVPLRREMGVYDVVRDATTGVYHGTLGMHLWPGQDPVGDVRCKAYTLNPRFGTQAELNDWVNASPANGPIREQERILSVDSNPRPLGEVPPDPAPEPGLIFALVLGVLGLWVAGWHRRTR